MPTLDLSRFGFNCSVDLQGTVEASWLNGNRLVFLFGESHSDREMKRLNIRHACRLIDAGVVRCVGTEVPMGKLDRLKADEVKEKSTALYTAHRTGEAVVQHLSLEQPWWYGVLEFGDTIRILRPSTPVRCVEESGPYEAMKPIRNA